MDQLDIAHRVTYAQNREDIFLEYFFKGLTDGFYVDVGANEPTHDSVTKLFYEKGWHGINIEPIGRLHKLLENERPRDTNLNIGIAAQAGEATLREYHTYHGLSTMTKGMQSEYDKSAANDKNYKDFTDYTVPVKTLKQVFDEYKVEHIHFLKVDVEGYEYEVLQGNDWQRYRPEVICIESNHLFKDWSSLLKEQGYSLVANDGLNDYYVSKDASKQARSFSYVEALLPSFYAPVIPYDFTQSIERMAQKYNLEVSKLTYSNAQFWNELNEVKHALEVAQAEIESSKRMRSLLRSLLVKTNAIIEERIYPQAQRDKVVSATDTAPAVPIVADADKQLAAIDAYDSTHLSNLKVKPHATRARLLKGYRSAKKPLKRAIGTSLQAIKKARG